MAKLFTILAATLIFLLGGCATFRGLKEDSSLAWQKMKGSFSGSSSSSTSVSTVRAAQSRLKARGYHSGAVDGVMGPQTVQALRRYQAANGLSVTGRIDEATRRSLGL